MRRAAVRTCVLVAVLAALGCKSGGWQLQNAVDSLVGDVESLFGASSPPARYLAEIREIHDRETWAFREGVDSPLQRTRTAVRALGTCDYSTWGETAYTVQVLAGMADEHPSSLVRAEALDTLTRIAPWTFAAAQTPARSTSHEEMIEGLKVLKDAIGRTDADAALTFNVATAVAALADYPFDRVDAPAPDKADPRTLARAYGTQLRTARAALRPITGRALEGFEADPGVREATDRAYVALSGAVIRLSLTKALLADAAETTRAAAAHDIGVLAVADAVPVLRTTLIYDGYASVRREAATALASYPRDAAVPALIEGLSDEMADVRGAAVRALESVTGETFGDDRAAWVRWWQANGAPKSAPGASR